MHQDDLNRPQKHGMPAQRFIAEIAEQPDALQRTLTSVTAHVAELRRLADALAGGRYRRIVLSGMGSSIYALYPLYLALVARLDLPLSWLEASELLHSAPRLLDDDTLLVAVSQSGESAEVVKLCSLTRPATVVSVSNGGDNRLARWADIPLLTLAGPEAAVSTKTYTTSLLALALLATILCRGDYARAMREADDAIIALATLLAERQRLTAEMAQRFGVIDGLTIIGRGRSLAAAWTGALITSESAKLLCLGISAGLFRHGPIELARSGFNAVILAGDDEVRALNLKLAGEIAAYGGRVLVIDGAAGAAAHDLDSVQLPPVARRLLPLLEIVPLQLLTIALAEQRGVTPAQFDNARKVTDSE